jgi:hypothetical protein
MGKIKDLGSKITAPVRVLSRLLGLVLLLALALGALPVSPVSAAIRSCRGDPKFNFSNGDTVTVVTTIAADKTSVSNVYYVLHAPKGLSLTKVVYTALGAFPPETSSVVFDQKAGVYWVDIYATSNVRRISVSSTIQLNQGVIDSVSGPTDQHLKLSLP